MSHQTIRDNDEVYCPRCQKRWGADEEPPETCVSTAPLPPKPVILERKPHHPLPGSHAGKGARRGGQVKNSRSTARPRYT